MVAGKPSIIGNTARNARDGFAVGAEIVGHHIAGGVSGAFNGAFLAAKAPAIAYSQNLSKALEADNNDDRIKYGSYAAFNLARYVTTFPIEMAWNVAQGAVTGFVSPQTSHQHHNIFNDHADLDAPGKKDEIGLLPPPPEPNLTPMPRKQKNAPQAAPSAADMQMLEMMNNGKGRGGANR